ncbi:hypothetical protein CEXT_176441 [Caerostris extrusa]|uniref:Uncharacterized protein n=1 Tax=Caerostris extrusa TaxID=172846 RepID=A0AAV4P7H1_CAEEX|nr:hypothetical protein CEXT_176441 [Caerostris extrusa]
MALATGFLVGAVWERVSILVMMGWRTSRPSPRTGMDSQLRERAGFGNFDGVFGRGRIMALASDFLVGALWERGSILVMMGVSHIIIAHHISNICRYSQKTPLKAVTTTRFETNRLLTCDAISLGINFALLRFNEFCDERRPLGAITHAIFVSQRPKWTVSPFKDVVTHVCCCAIDYHLPRRRQTSAISSSLPRANALFLEKIPPLTIVRDLSPH